MASLVPLTVNLRALSIGISVGSDAGFVTTDGTTPLVANWNVGGFILQNLADPVSAQDAATKAYVDSHTASLSATLPLLISSSVISLNINGTLTVSGGNLSVVYGTTSGTALQGSNDALYVHLAGSENVTGTKTFSSASGIISNQGLLVNTTTALGYKGIGLLPDGTGVGLIGLLSGVTWLNVFNYTTSGYWAYGEPNGTYNSATWLVGPTVRIGTSTSAELVRVAAEGSVLIGTTSNIGSVGLGIASSGIIKGKGSLPIDATGALQLGINASTTSIAIGESGVPTTITGNIALVVGSDANYDVYYRNSSGILARLGYGTTKYVLQTQNSSGPPQWVSAILADGTVALSGTWTLDGTHGITGLPTPVNPSDATTKAYVDALSVGLDPKPAVALATAATPLSSTAPYTVVGDVMTALNPGAFPTIDNILITSASANPTFLLKSEASSVNNGIWKLTTTGTVGTPWIAQRISQLDTGASASGAFVFVEEGTANIGAGFVCVSVPGSDIVGTNNLTWTQFSGAGEITVSLPLLKSGNNLSLNYDATLTLSGSNLSFATTQPNANTWTLSQTFSAVVYVATGTSNGIDTSSAGSLVLGFTNANAIALGHSGITTTVTGGLTQLTGAVSLTGNGASTFTTTSGSLTLTAAAASTWKTSSGALTVDSATALNLGTIVATSIAIGYSSITTTVTGGLTQLTGAVSLTGNAASSFTTSAGSLTLTAAAASTWKTSAGALTVDSATALNLGTVVATSVAIGYSSITTTVTGGLTQLTGAVSLTGNAASTFTTTSGSLTFTAAAASTWKTSAGALTVDSATALNLGTVAATSIAIGQSGITTTITGGLTQLTGAVSLTGNSASSFTTSSGALTFTAGAASTWKTSSGALTVDSATVLNLGTVVATSVAIGNGTITTAVTGLFTTSYSDSVTNTTTEIAKFTHLTSGTPTVNFGVAAGMYLDDNNGIVVEASKFITLWTSASTGSTSSRIDLQTEQTGTLATSVSIGAGFMVGTTTDTGSNFITLGSSGGITSTGATRIDATGALSLGNNASTTSVVINSGTQTTTINGISLHTYTDAGTSNTVEVLTVKRKSSGTPAANFANAIGVYLDDSTNVNVEALQLTTYWKVATHGSTLASAVGLKTLVANVMTTGLTLQAGVMIGGNTFDQGAGTVVAGPASGTAACGYYVTSSGAAVSIATISGSVISLGNANFFGQVNVNYARIDGTSNSYAGFFSTHAAVPLFFGVNAVTGMQLASNAVLQVGTGDGTASTGAFTIRGANATGSNTAANVFSINAGLPTGNATLNYVELGGSIVAASGSSQQTYGAAVRAYGNFVYHPGGQAIARTAVADAAYGNALTDFLVAYTSLTAARIVTGPTTTSIPSGAELFIRIKDESANATPPSIGSSNPVNSPISFTPASGTVDGQTTVYGPMTSNEVASYYFDNTNWHRLETPPPVAGGFGDGTNTGQGSVSGATTTFNGGSTTTLSADIFCQNLHITNSTVLDTNGWGVFVAGTTTIDAGSSMSANGAAASGATGGGSRNNETFGGGGKGGNGTSTTAGAGTGLAGYALGGSGGNGGASGTTVHAGGTGGATVAPAATAQSIRLYDNAINGAVYTPSTSPNTAGATYTVWGGGGGASGGGDGTNAGGGGGAGGGVLMLATRVLINNGTISVKGGKGANGVAGNAGGGGGGGGGLLILICPRVLVTGTITATGGTFGTASGSGGSSGVAGSAGVIVALLS